MNKKKKCTLLIVNLDMTFIRTKTVDWVNCFALATLQIYFISLLWQLSISQKSVQKFER